ncbi:PREDICTED: uncharacterized protein LOC107161539 [Diuraphis noxia]|uniref:uncharacterized protein LOC107161539 n=1 Tax=Diuraphis noxia TaxID=143948 RepID=UPI0007635BA1|nr:PREDICTED: uncharacterized protein LOC107161539 [Diuraphis noxia]
MDSDVDSELKSDFTSYLEHISQRKKFQQNSTLTEHSYSSSEYQQDNLCSTIQTLFIHRFVQSENSSDDVDIETIDKDVKLLTYRPEVEPKSIESYRNSKLPRDPEMWEDNINKYVYNFLPWDYEEYSREEELDIETSLEAMVDATRSKVVSVRSEDSSRPIILAGVGVSAAIACQVAVLEKVEGLVCIGFIVNSSEVKRGYEGDCILGLDCPTVFVTGQLSIFSPVLDMEELRVKLKCKTNHILVGGANDELVMNHTTKMREAVTQKLVDRCVLEEIGNFLKDILEPSPKIIRKPDVENTDFKKPVFSKKKPNNKSSARLNKGSQKLMVSANKQTPKRQTANRKVTKTSNSSLSSNVIAKDEELMPPPSSSVKQEYYLQCENADSTSNSIQQEDNMFIPKLGNQKFSTLAELLQEQDNFNFNVSQTTSSLTSMNGSPVIFTPDQKNIVVCSSNFQSLQDQSAAPVVEEITPDQILDMPIVFADEPQEEEEVEVKHNIDNSSYFIANLNEFNERKMVVKEEPVDEDDNFDVLCPTISRTTIPERLKIKQVAYDSPSKVKLVVNKAPKGLVPSGYQTFSVPSQNSGNIQFVNRLPISGNKIRRIEGGMNSRVVPKTVSIRHIQDSNIKILKSNTGQQINLNKIKTMATTQKFKKII